MNPYEVFELRTNGEHVEEGYIGTPYLSVKHKAKVTLDGDFSISELLLIADALRKFSEEGEKP